MKHWKETIKKEWETHTKAIMTIGISMLMVGALVFGITDGLQLNPDTRAPQNSEQAVKQSFESKVTEKQQELVNPVEPYAPDSIVLSNTTEERAKELADELGAEVRITKKGDFATLYLPEGVTINDVYENEKYSADILEMTPDYSVRTTAVDALGRELMAARPQYEVADTQYSSQSYLDYLDMQDVWSKTKGSGVKIAVIDTGIDTDNPEFEGRISNLSYNASDDKTVADYGIEQIEDEQGHGTSVAGVMVSNMDGKGITGIAPEAELIVIKCECDKSGTFVRGSDLVFGLAYAIECDADVVNMSFGTPTNLFSKYTKLAVDSDVICVAAAGNEGSSIPCYPAADKNVIGVGSLAADDWSLASYSNFGDNSEIVAPGTTYTTEIGGGYGYSMGTSLASPVTAATIALYLSEHNHTEYSVMCEMLEASSTDLGTAGEDWYYGFGSLDAAALIGGEVGTITYDMQTDELDDITQRFVRGHVLQKMPEPEREDVVFDGWYMDPECDDECEYYTQIFAEDTTLYAGWINEDEGSAYIYRKLDDGTAEITSYTGKRKYLTVPDKIEGLTVSSIGEDAFNGNQRLRSVILPDSIKSIGDRAFYNCTALRGMDIPDKVTSIGNNAFTGCSRMISVGIAPNGSLTSVGDGAFSMCGISTFHIPAKLSQLGEGVFIQSTAMRSITVECSNATFTVINQALFDASGKTLLYYPAGLTGSYAVAEGTETVGQSAFAYCRINQIDLPNGLLTIADGAFAGSGLRNVSLPASLTHMGDGAFSGCYSLSTVSYADGCSIDHIPMFAFSDCYQLNTINIPDTVEIINMGAFGSTGLKQLAFGTNSQLKMIESSAFAYSSLEEIALPEKLETIGIGAFSCCTSLCSIQFGTGSSCAAIERSAFENCTSLKTIEFPDSLIRLGDKALYGTGLEQIHIGAGLTSIGEGTLGYCTKLEEIDVSGENPAYSSFDGLLYDHDGKILITCPAAKNGNVSTAASTELILGYAFAGTGNLTSITLNDRLKEIGQFAFLDSGIQTPILPEGLETINESAFQNCQSMTNRLLIPKSVISLGRYMVYGDGNLTEIEVEADSALSRIGYGTFSGCGIETFTIPENVSTLGQEIFSECKSLITVTFEADNRVRNLAAWTFTGADKLRRITFEDGCSLTLIEARACEGMTSLDRIDLSGCTDLTTIDNYAFRNCSGLDTVLLPASLKEIGRYAFTGCKSLKRLNVPASVEWIGRYAFKATESLHLYFRSSVLPTELEQNWDYDLAGYYLDVEDQIENDDWVYALTSDGKASVISYKGSDADIVLSAIDGHDVVSIGGEAFKDNATLHSIVLPEGLKSVCKSAFENTSSLQSVTLPSSLEVIDAKAFKGSAASTIEVPENSALRMIGRYAFADTDDLASFTIPEGVKTLSDYAFYRSTLSGVAFAGTPTIETIGRYAFAKTGLSSIALPDSVTMINDCAFKNAEQLTSVTFGSGANLKLCAQAFYGSGLVTVAIPANVTVIEELCFAGCESLTEINVDADNEKYASIDGVLFNKAGTILITCPAGKNGSYSIPAEVSRLAFAAFEGSSLSSVQIPDGNLNTIGYRAFFRCENLEHITIPAGVQSVDNYAFAYDKNLISVEISSGNQLSGIYKSAFYNCEKLTGINIPDSAQEIGEYAFYGCTAMNDVGITADSHLKIIADHAFEYAGINHFTMPSEVLEVGDYAFRGAKLKTFAFNQTITNLGNYALAESGLTDTKELILPTTLEYVGENILEGIQGIEELTLPFLGSNPEEMDSGKASMKYTLGYSSFTEAINQYANLKKITVLGGLLIGTGAFEGIPAEYIYLPNTCEEVGSQAFFICKSLKQVVLPIHLDKLSSSMFAGCNCLESIDIPEACIAIESQAFYGCSSMEALTISKNVETIAEDAFIDCDGLMSIVVDDANRYFKSVSGVLYDYDVTKMILVPRGIKGEVIIPEGITTIGTAAFSGCKNVEKIVMPDTLIDIGSYTYKGCTVLKDIRWSVNLKTIGEEAFRNTGFEEVVLPDSITTIGNRAWMDNESLKKITLPDNLNELAWDMFYFDTNLEEVIIGKNAKSIGGQCFYECHKLEHITLPDSMKEIMKYSFYGCTSLKSIRIPKDVEVIEKGAFTGCSNLETIVVDDNNEQYCSQDGILYDKQVTKVIYVPCAISGTVRVKNGIKEIDSGAFSGNNGITEIVLPDSVEKIGDQAFAYCHSLRKLSFGSGITDIGEMCIWDTPYITNTDNYYDGIVYVGSYAVERGYYPMDKSVRIKDGTKVLGKNLLNSEDVVEEIYLPDSVEYINDNACFYACSISKIRLSKNLKHIGEEAFRGCYKIKSINFANNDITTGLYPFSECSLEYIRTKADSPITIGSNSGKATTYVGAYAQYISPNTEYLVLENEAQVKNSNFDPNNTKVFVRVDAENNELTQKNIDISKIYTEGEWNLCTFYVNDMIVTMKPLKRGEVVHAPAQNLIKEYLPEEATFTGWDINGDGTADTLPSTLSEDLEAVAVYDAPIVSVTINEQADIEVGGSKTLRAKIRPAMYNHDDSLIWTSTNDEIVTVDGSGKIKGISEGTATVRAALSENENLYSECTINVTPATYGVKLPTSSGEVNAGGTYTLDPEIVVPDDYTAETEYESADESIATVDKNGVITGVKAGETDITISYGRYSATFNISVLQPMTGVSLEATEGRINVEDTVQLKVNFEPADTTDDKTVTWHSKDTSIATVNSTGLVTGVGPGNTEITGTVGGFTLAYKVNVDAPIQSVILNTTTGTMRLDKTKQLEMIFTPANTNADRTVVWSSGNDKIASVSEDGLVTALKQGRTVITGTVGSGTDHEFSATYTVTVIGLRDPVTGITVTNSDNTEMEEGTTLEVDEVSETDAQDQYGNYKGAIKLLIHGRNGRIYIMYVYDISLLRNNIVVQPGKSVDVDIPIPQGGHTNGSLVFRMESDGSFTNMNAGMEDGHFRFKTDHFSDYCLAVPTDKYEADEVQLDKDKIELCVGNTETITATVLPTEAEDKKVTYESDDEATATVDSSGKVTAKLAGSANITVKSAVAGVDKTVEVTVVAHDYQDIEGTAVAATCTKAGKKADQKCSRCGDEKEGEAVKALGHDYTVEVKGTAKAATCTEDGKEADLKCSRCDSIETGKKINATGHNYGELIAEVSATCTEDGTAEHYECSVCKKLFDQDKKQITAEGLIITAPGHDWSDWTTVKEATEEEEGLETRSCSRDATHTEERTIPKLAHVHNLVKTEAVAAKCEEAGNIEYWTCSKCGLVYDDENATNQLNAENLVILALKHDYKVEVEGTAVAATCTEDGKEADLKCSRCDSVKTGKTIEATGHSYGELIAEVPVKCEKDGTTAHYECSKCEALFDKDKKEVTEGALIIKAPGHNYQDVEGTAAAATCTKDGKKADQKCSRCGDEKEGEVIKAPGHNYGELIKEVPATCTEDGTAAHYECSVCKKLFDQEKKQITAEELIITTSGHDWSDWTTVEEATEEEEGLETRSCSRDATHTEERTIPKLKHVHSLEKTEAVAAKCEEAGNIEYWTCKGCGLIYDDENATNQLNEEDLVISALKHDYQKVEGSAVAPTCEKDGKEADQKCSHCEKVITGAVIEALGHDYKIEVDGTAKDATCTEDGKKADLKCSRCDSVKTGKKIEATGHNYGDLIAEVPAECEKDGTAAHYQCTNCHGLFDAKKKAATAESLKLEALGHDYKIEVEGTAKAVTCTEDGKEADLKCSRCDSTKAGKKIDALGHEWDDGTVTKEPTYTEEGIRTYTCKHDQNHKRTEAIPMLVPTDITPKVTLSKTSLTYNGKVQVPAVTVKNGDTILERDIDYTVTASSSKNVGTYKVTVTLKNAYKGSGSASYSIYPKGTSVSKLTKGKKQMTVQWGKQATQTTGYQIRYSLKKNFKSGVKTVVVTKAKTTKTVIKKLKPKKTYYVQIRTYKEAGKKVYCSGWSKTMSIKVK